MWTTNQSATTNSPPIEPGSSKPERDTHGRFLTGNSGGGRPKGSKNKLGETVLTAIADDFAAHGLEAIARVRQEDPATYLRIVGALIPRELILKREQQPDVDYADMSHEELNELLRAESRRQLVEIGLETVRKRPELIAQKR